MFFKRLASIVLTMVMVLTITIPAQASTSLTDSLDNIVAYYQSHHTALSSWEEAVALRSAGVDLKQSPWKAPGWNLNSLGKGSQPTDYAGVVLGRLACGQNPANVNSRDLVSELAKMQKSDGSFAGPLNQTVLSVIALDTAKAQGAYQAGKAVAYIIAQHKPDGGYALYGNKADADMTGLTLIALAKHTDYDGVPSAIKQAKAALKKIQQSDGGFSYGGLENAESTATVIRGLTACGENVTASAWTKNGRTMIDALFSFQLKDRSFAHMKGGTSDPIATRQALNAVADLVNGNVFANIEAGNNPRPYGWPDVRVRVEGATANLADTRVRLQGSALDALKKAVGSGQVQLSGGMITGIDGESGNSGANPPTSWFYYVIRNGAADTLSLNSGADSYNIRSGDQLVFYIGAYDPVTWAGKTYYPLVSVSPQSPRAGDNVTLSIKAQKNDWGTLTDLTAVEARAVGEYTVYANGKSYASHNGKVVIPSVSAGTLSFTVTNPNPAGYPDVVTYKGSVQVAGAAAPAAPAAPPAGTAAAAAAGSGLVLTSGSSQSETAAGSDKQPQQQNGSQVQSDQSKQEGSSHTWVWPVSVVVVVAALVILALSQRKQ